MSKFLYAVLTGLFGAVLLHIIIILGVPHFTGRDAYTRVTSEGVPFVFHALSAAPDAAGLSSLDPYLRVAVCHFDIERQPLSLVALGGGVDFWSVAIYDRDANEVFSMNDRTSVAGDLDVLVATPVQVAQLRKTPIAALAETILVDELVVGWLCGAEGACPAGKLRGGCGGFSCGRRMPAVYRALRRG